MFIDIYAIQNVPPCNVNRDDTGTPKTAMYGGVRRARVSSQAWKRAMRKMFPSLLPETKLGYRTKLAARLIEERIVQERPDLAETAESLATAVLKAAGMKIKATDRKGSDEGTASTEYLVFIADSELAKLAKVAIEWADTGINADKLSAQDKKRVSEVFHGVQAVDIALFGRMLADAPDLNTDASAQVAHAISVDRVTQEYDYFTAVDDCAAEDNAGAAMIDTVGFNSSTLYRYATVDIDALFGQLGNADAAAEGTAAFVEAFVRSMPTGKQNTFANRTLPSAVSVAFRKQQPINLVSAFENPIRPTEDESITLRAVERLASKKAEMERAYGDAVDAWSVLVGLDDKQLSALGEKVTLAELLENVRNATRNHLASRE